MVDKKFLEEEIKAAKITIEKLENGLFINKLVLKAFEEEWKKEK